MVGTLVEALVNDSNLLWWVSVTPSPILRDICETTMPTWKADFQDVSFLALRAAVSTINVTGHEALMLSSYDGNKSTVNGTWRGILHEVKKSRERMDDANYLLFDVWEYPAPQLHR